MADIIILSGMIALSYIKHIYLTLSFCVQAKMQLSFSSYHTSSNLVPDRFIKNKV